VRGFFFVMKLPTSCDVPVFEIKDDARCVQIARHCGLDPELFRLRMMEHNLRTKEPSYGVVILDHAPEVLILQFFTGYEHAHQNGWSIIGFANTGIYLRCLPSLLKHIYGESHNISWSPIILNN
jgi:hypothetical protein